LNGVKSRSNGIRIKKEKIIYIVINFKTEFLLKSKERNNYKIIPIIFNKKKGKNIEMEFKDILQSLQPIIMMMIMSKVDYGTSMILMAIIPMLWPILKFLYGKYYTVKVETMAKVVIKTVSHGRKQLGDKFEGEDAVDAVAQKLVKIQKDSISELIIPKSHLVFIQDEIEREKYNQNYRPVISAIPQGNFEFIYNDIPCLATIQISKEEKAETTSITLSSINCSVSVLYEFVQKAVDEKWEREHIRLDEKFVDGIYTWSMNGWGFRELTVHKTFDNVHLPLKLQNDIENDIDIFIQKKQLYEQQGIPHKRGFLFYGPPGTGKSSCVYALAHKLKYHVRVLSLKKISNLTYRISSIRDPCIILLEEIDFQISSGIKSVVIDKNNDTEKNCNSDTNLVSELMHILDGYDCDLNDKIVIMTTNHKNDIPEALIRPGRIDRHFHFGLSDSQEATRVARKFTGINDLPYPDNDKIRISSAELINRVLLPNIDDPVILAREMRNLTTGGNSH